MPAQAFWIPTLLAISAPFLMRSSEPMTVIQALDKNGRAPFVDCEAWTLATRDARETETDPQVRIENLRIHDYLAWSDSSQKFE